MIIIDFKSLPENWFDEKMGIKKWTIREKDTDMRFKILGDYYELFKKSHSIHNLYVRITNTESGQKFKRKVCHIYPIEKYVIISWS
jgi:hypothetical protein